MKSFEKQLKVKEFEKWSGKNCKNGNCPARSGHDISCTACENLQEKAWRAALKMVLDKMKDETTSYTHIHTEIEQELGDG